MVLPNLSLLSAAATTSTCRGEEKRDDVKKLRLLLSAQKKHRSVIQSSLERLRLSIQGDILNGAEVVAGTLSSRLVCPAGLDKCHSILKHY